MAVKHPAEDNSAIDNDHQTRTREFYTGNITITLKRRMQAVDVKLNYTQYQVQFFLQNTVMFTTCHIKHHTIDKHKTYYI